MKKVEWRIVMHSVTPVDQVSDSLISQSRGLLVDLQEIKLNQINYILMLRIETKQNNKINNITKDSSEEQ